MKIDLNDIPFIEIIVKNDRPCVICSCRQWGHMSADAVSFRDVFRSLGKHLEECENKGSFSESK